MLTAIGPDAAPCWPTCSASPSRPTSRRPICWARSATRRRATRARRAHRARAERKGQGQGAPAVDLQGDRRRRRPGGREVPRGRRSLGPNKDEAALRPCARWRAARPAVLPFALKVAGDPKADKLVRDEMFGVIEGIGGLEARQGPAGDHLVRQGGAGALPRVRVGDRDVEGRGDRARRSTRSRPAPPTRRSTSTICW